MNNRNHNNQGHHQKQGRCGHGKQENSRDGKGKANQRDERKGNGGARNGECPGRGKNDDEDFIARPQRQGKTLVISHYVTNYLQGDQMTPNSSQQFLTALMDERFDTIQQLIRITKDETSLGRFRQCFMYLESDDYFYKIIRFFWSPKLSFGTAKYCVSQCCEEIYHSRLLQRLNLSQTSQGDNALLLSWFLLKVMSTLSSARSDTVILQLAARLQLIQPELTLFLSSTSSFAVEQNISLFETKHDNDFPFDFRQVQLIPSTNEILSNCDMVTLIANRLNILYSDASSISRTLEYQFRFLRENWVQTLKEEYFEERKKSDFLNSRRVYNNPIMIGFNTSKTCDKVFVDVLVTPNANILKLLKENKSKLKDYLSSKAGSRILPINSSIFLLDDTGLVVAIGTVSSRDIDQDFIENFQAKNTIKLGLSFPSNVLRKLLLSSTNSSHLKQNNERKNSTIQIPLSHYLYSSSVVSFVLPILSCLKTMTSIPFEEEIIHSRPSATLTMPLDFKTMMDQMDHNTDRTQIDALRLSCKNRFTLIQGPPGTGKTFIGVKLANHILKHTSNRILTLSYTNHALDSFMESIMDSDPSFESYIKRLGKSHKTSERMKQHAIGNKKFTFSQLMCSRELKEQLTKQVEELNKTIFDFYHSIRWNDKSWDFVKDYISQYDDRDLLNQFDVPDDIHIIGRNNKPMRNQDLFRSWFHGDSVPIGLNFTPTTLNIWNLTKKARHNLLERWNNEYRQILLNDCLKLYETCERMADQLSNLNNETKIQEIHHQTRLLGSTTSAACLSSDLVNQFQPSVLIIEEAAEILEAHILVNIPSSVKHVILIGDHKQLRPKVDLYSLRKVSNHGINLDISLFERLACTYEFELATLGVQHRMRPEFSEIIRRATYPELRDHNSTSGRSSILGLQSNLIFVDHNFPENSQQDILVKVAKVNEHEAEMVVKTVLYLLMQGYKSDDIIVLTPYLGQLFHIHELLSRAQMKAQISKLDADDLDANGFNSIDSPEFDESTPRGVRVATVDNFQGEESKIVICSLVRCNPEGNIGFLYEPQRVNVLCSRARDGFILFGSISTLLKSSGGFETWDGTIRYLRSKGYIFSGLPTVCQRHNTLNILSVPEDFDEKTPDGGCLRPCEAIIETCTSTVKHRCWRKCHAASNFHKVASCQSEVEVTCINGHILKKQCCTTTLPVCSHMIDVPCQRGLHTQKITCGSGSTTSKKCTQKIRTRCSNMHDITVRCDIDDSKYDAYCSICKEGKKLSQDPRYEEEVKSKEDELKAVQLQAEVSKLEFTHYKKLKELDDRIAENKTQCLMYAELQNNSDSSQSSRTQQPVQNNTQITSRNQKILKDKTDVNGNKIKPFSNDLSSIEEKKEDPILLSITQGFPVLSHSSIKKSSVKKAQISTTSPLSSDYFMEDDLQMSSDYFMEDDFQIPSSLTNKQRKDDNQQKLSTLPKLPLSSFESKEVETHSTADDQEDEEVDDDDNDDDNHQRNIDPVPLLLNLVSLASQQKYIDLFLTCEKYEKKSPLELYHMAIECLKFFAEWKLGYCSDPHQQYQKKINSMKSLLSNSKRTELSSICNGIIRYLEFCFHTSRTSMKPESLCLSAWECDKSLSDIDYDAFKLWKNEVSSIIDQIKDKGFRSISLSKEKKKRNVSEARETALDKWNLCVQSFLQSKKEDDEKTSPSTAVDNLMKMIGLESVKNEFVTLYNHILISNKRGSGHAASYNIRFEGNPGTGKTTVARHYAKFLKEVNILPPECKFIETSGSKLIIDGTQGLKKELEALKECEGGVVFVDEAYQLEPSMNQQGAQILNFILPLAERLEGEYGKIVWIFAGYVDDMEKLFNFNVGLRSRFPSRFVFEDYTNSELELIFKEYLKNQPPPPNESDKEKKSNKSKDLSSNATSTSNLQNRGVMIQNSRYANLFGVKKGETRTDEWGNIWTVDLDNNRWIDEYGNVNAFGPNPSSQQQDMDIILYSLYYQRQGKLGSNTNPIFNEKSGISWVYDQSKKVWYDKFNPSNISARYPGKPLPQKKVNSIPFHVEDEKWIRIAIRRIASRRNLKGFGNARDVRLYFDKCIQRQSDRLSRLSTGNMNRNIDMHLLIRDDILGPKASLSALEKCSAYQQLLEMEGLDQMKQVIKEILQMVIENSEKEEREEPLLELSLNRVFLGNPGTGKTTVAQLYGRILCSLGMLSKGDTLLKNPSDFVSNIVGGSESQTRAILTASEGCVLVIDEAYMLNPFRSSGLATGNGDPFKAAVLDTLVEQVQGVPGSDRVVILLGYKKDMEDMFRNCNPGLSRRFQFDNPVVFEDYDDTALMNILKSKATQSGLNIDLKTSIFAIKQLSKKRSLPNFGNAGEINNMLNDAKRYVASRGSNTLCQADFCKDGRLPVEGSVDTVMNDLIGNDDIDALIQDYKKLVNYAEQERKDVKKLIDYNFLFVGNPGTGKTTVARKMGEVFYHLNLLPSSDVVDISAQDLVTGYLGQTGKKTAETLHKARGKVLFIDEAYQLNPQKGGQYMQEAVDEIVKSLTSPEIRGNMVLILAGYENDMDEMLATNQGLRSRISKKIYFPDFSNNKICQLLKSELQKLEFRLTSKALQELPTLADRLRLQPGFSNGRDVEILSRKIMTNALRENKSIVTPDVLRTSFNELLRDMGQSKARSISNPTNSPSFVSIQQMMPAINFSSPPPMNTSHQMIRKKGVEPIQDLKSEQPVEDINQSFLQSLQIILDEKKLNSKEGIEQLLNLSENEFDELATELANRLDLDIDLVKQMIREWQKNQQKMLITLNDAERELANMKKTKKRGRVPIWRCAACGRANQPYIVCYVSPYVVRYEERDLN